MDSREPEDPVQCDLVNMVPSEAEGDAILSSSVSAGSSLESDFTHPSRVPEGETGRQMQHKRDQLLEATARAANVLLTLENLSEAIHTALNIVGEGIGCDIVAVLENEFESSSRLPSQFNFIYEWAAPGFRSLATNFGSNSLPSELLGSDFLEQYFLFGAGFGGLLDVWTEPLRSWLAAVQIQSAYTVPIRVNGQWWGVLCLDYCRAPIQISTAEISVLMMIADCIGSAIQRDRLQQERKRVTEQRAAEMDESNQRLLRRDQLLEATAKAANVLLTLDDIDEAINTALRITLEAIGCDRINILENGYAPSFKLPVSYATIYEWVVPDFEPSHIIIDDAQAIGLDPAFMEQYFLQGEGFGGLLEEWPDPPRSAFAAVQIQSAYSVAIRVNGHWWGVLCFEYCRAPIQINPAEVAVVRTIADCIGSAIQRDRTQKALLEAEQNRVAELARANTAIRHSIDWLAHEPDMNAFLGHLLEELATQVNAQDAMIFLYNAQERTLETFVGFIDDEITFSPPFPPKMSAQEWLGWEVLLRSPTPRHFDPDTDAHLFMLEYLEYHRRRNNQGVVCTLLQQGDEPLGFIGFGCDRKTLSENELGLVQSLAQQATLAIQLTQLAEEAKQTALLQERARMAREIHDTLAQAFGGILMQLQAFTYFAQTQPDQAQPHLLTAQALAQEGLTEARRSVWTLYLETTEYENLDQAIAKFIEQTQPRQSTPIHLAIEGTPYALHPDFGLNLLRIAQEAITNALRHAHATTIQVHLSYSANGLQLTIRDDGCGFDPQSTTHGFGLLGMHQRASRIGATWNLMSRPGQGTTLMITLTNSQNTTISKA